MQHLSVSSVHLRTVRLVTGLILFAYVTTHFLNHAAGLVSLEALETARHWFLALWRNPPGTVMLYGALGVHLSLAFWSIYRRRTLRMHLWEGAQLLLGLMVPPLMVLHVLGTRLAYELFDTNDSYTYVVLSTWVFAPWVGIRQAVGLLVAWLHGCLGLHFWLRIRPWYPRAAPWLFAVALLVPVLALLGFVRAGQEIDRLVAEPGWLDQASAAIRFPGEAEVARIYRLQTDLLAAFALLLAATLAARGLRGWLSRHRSVTVGYPDGQRVVIQRGATILDASRVGRIPHASVCGGRGRCSTCRVRVSAGAEHLPPPSAEEARVLARVKAGLAVRLACQTRPHGDVEVVPLLPATAPPRAAYAVTDLTYGHEEEVAILFADLRAFTALAARKLPYDVVFLLNRYFRAMGTAVEEAGGRVDKFIGDGVMALFGIGRGAGEGCRQALDAARRMAMKLEQVNAVLAHDLDGPLRIGVGIHVGPVIVGEMGYGRVTAVTAIGDAVNTASRLESLTKDYGSQLVVSEAVARHAGIDLSAFPRHEIMLRGREEAVIVRVVADARALPETAPPRPRERRRFQDAGAGAGPAA
ncbi:MAG: 2Fe-2S iron-sulfur cluster binding domain-containing protein [Rhodospirillaceae bacterium]|nr:2Fe-2S iron-sulfur cluster binding domain-containing protein [Rhodospirillaceae bacterium]